MISYPHFIQFKKSFSYRASTSSASGHLHYLLSFPVPHLEAATERLL